jgi:hypothetical protein
MSWKFWQKKSEEGPSESKVVKLPGPKRIPEPVGRYLVVKLGKDPDWVWHLDSVSRQRLEDKHAFDIRVFDSNQTESKRVIVKDYNSLDAHPELILFEGWYDKKSMKVEILAKELPTSRAA